jgi:flagellar assembly factor FliW
MVKNDSRPSATPADEQALFFGDGIPGFPALRRFALVDLAADGAFQLLQSLDDPDVAMVVSVPWLFFPDYAPELGEADQRQLGIDAPEDAVVFCPVALDPEGETVHVNLLGPFVVNPRTKQGRQVVLSDPSLPLRAPVRLPKADADAVSGDMAGGEG